MRGRGKADDTAAYTVTREAEREGSPIEPIYLVFLAAILVEALVEVVKGWLPANWVAPAWLWPVASAALGVALCVLGKVDVLALIGLTLSVPLAGSVLTGILISRGSNFLHDLWGRINAGKTGAGQQG